MYVGMYITQHCMYVPTHTVESHYTKRSEIHCNQMNFHCTTLTGPHAFVHYIIHEVTVRVFFILGASHCRESTDRKYQFTSASETARRLP